MRRILFLALVALALVGVPAHPAVADTGSTSTGSVIIVYNPGFVANAVSGRIVNYPSNVYRLTVVAQLFDGSHRNYDVGPFNGWSFVFQGIQLAQIKSVTVAGLPSGSPAPTVTTSPGYTADLVFVGDLYGYGYGGYGYGGYSYGGYGWGPFSYFGYGYCPWYGLGFGPWYNGYPAIPGRSYPFEAPTSR